MSTSKQCEAAFLVSSFRFPSSENNEADNRVVKLNLSGSTVNNDKQSEIWDN